MVKIAFFKIQSVLTLSGQLNARKTGDSLTAVSLAGTNERRRSKEWGERKRTFLSWDRAEGLHAEDLVRIGITGQDEGEKMPGERHPGNLFAGLPFLERTRQCY